MPISFNFLSCSDSNEIDSTIGKIVIKPDDPNEESINATIISSDSNWTKSKVHFGRARKYYEKFETLIDKKVIIEFFNTNGILTSTMISDSGKIDDKTNDMYAYNNVLIHSLENKTIVIADSIGYFSNDKIFKSKSKIKLVDSIKFREIEGIGFESDNALQNYKIYDVSGISGR